VAWTSPSLSELQTKLRRDLRDTNGDAFTPDMLMDYANEGITELGRVKPIETRGLITEIPFVFEPPAPVDIWAVVLGDGSGGTEYLAPMDENVSGDGWTYYGRELIFGPRLLARLSQYIHSVGSVEYPDGTLSPYNIAWYGYRGRDVFDGDVDEIADFIDPEDEICVRRYVRWAGFRALDTDRTLYQQWQTQANNSDVSPTQLNQMVGMAETEWDALRRKVMILRHAPLGTR